MSKINKIFIESFFKKSGSDCDFKTELEETIATSDKAVCYIDDIVLPNVFKTIDSRNNKLYLTISILNIKSNTIIILDDGYYNGFSFAEEITKKLKVYTDYITQSGLLIAFDVTAAYDLLSNTITFRYINKTNDPPPMPNPIVITIHSNKDLLNGSYESKPLNIYEIRSINETIGNIEKSIILENDKLVHNCILNLATLKSIYLFCSELSSNDTISNFQQNNIIKKIILNSSQNEINITQAGNNVDYLTINKRLLKSLNFKLCDKFGTVLDLYGHSISFTITIINK
jgi:hypothetical protein